VVVSRVERHGGMDKMKSVERGKGKSLLCDQMKKGSFMVPWSVMV
jgi:hypothetical protein